MMMLLLFGVSLGREAQASYNPSTGRWIRPNDQTWMSKRVLKFDPIL